MFYCSGDYDFCTVPSIEDILTYAELRYIDKEGTYKPVFDGSFMLYRKTPEVVHFLQTWYDEWIEQVSTPWRYEFAYERWQGFDMFTAWKILNADKHKHASAYKEEYQSIRKLKWKMIDKSWNASHLYPQHLLTHRTVIMQIDRSAYLCKNKYPGLLKRLHDIVRYKKHAVS